MKCIVNIMMLIRCWRHFSPSLARTPSFHFDDGSQGILKSGEKLSIITKGLGPGYLRNLDDCSVIVAQEKNSNWLILLRRKGFNCWI